MCEIMLFRWISGENPSFAETVPDNPICYDQFLTLLSYFNLGCIVEHLDD
jgi:hypothetical protein